MGLAESSRSQSCSHSQCNRQSGMTLRGALQLDHSDALIAKDCKTVVADAWNGAPKINPTIAPQ